MAKKAKLDILDVPLDEPAGSAEPVEDEPAPDEGGGKKGRSVSGGWIVRAKAWVHAHWLWILLLALAYLGAMVGLGLWYLLQQDKPATPQGGHLASLQPPARAKTITLSGFAVDQRDEKGTLRIAFCDIALELERGDEATALEKRIDVREAIYKILKKKRIEEVLSAESRASVKEELQQALIALVGKNRIREVYITAYEAN